MSHENTINTGRAISARGARWRVHVMAVIESAVRIVGRIKGNVQDMQKEARKQEKVHEHQTGVPNKQLKGSWVHNCVVVIYVIAPLNHIARS